MDEQRDIEAPMSPGSYVQFLLANATQEVTQLIKNYLSLGQFEAARASILQLIDLDKEAACKLVYEILQTPHQIHETPSIPSSAHLTWMLITEYHSMNANGQLVARELIQATEFEMILEDLVLLKIFSLATRKELFKMFKAPTSAQLSSSLKQELSNAFSTYPILAHTLCTLISTRCHQVGNVELSRVLWGLLVSQAPQNLSLLQYMTFSSVDEPANASNVFESLVALHFPPKSMQESFGNPIRQQIYSNLLALPPNLNFALRLYSNIEETAMRRECEKVSSGLAWPFEVLRPYERTANTETTNLLLHEFWSQYFDFIAISKNHFIEFIITQFFDLIHEHRFEDCRILLTPFAKLKPLLLLMCFDKFGDDVKSKQQLLDILWSTSSSVTDPTSGIIKNQELHDRVNSIAYQIKLARWAGSLLLRNKDLSTNTTSTGMAPTHDSSLVVGSQMIKNIESIEEPDFALANVVSGMLKQHGIIYILHHYLHNIPLESIELIVKETPIETSRGTQEQATAVQTDLILLYCYYSLKGVIQLLQSASAGTADPTEIISTLATAESIIAKIHDPSARLSLLEIVFNFIFMRSSAWNDPDVRVLTMKQQRSNANTEQDSFVVGPELASGLVQLIRNSIRGLKENISATEAPSSIMEVVSHFEKKVTEAEWRVLLIQSHPYFLTPLLTLDSDGTTQSSIINQQGELPNARKSEIFVNVLIARPESLLTRSIRERDFTTAHAIVEFFKMDKADSPSESTSEGNVSDEFSSQASHLAKVSELVYTIRNDLNAGKLLSETINPLIHSSPSPGAERKSSPSISTASAHGDSTSISTSPKQASHLGISKIEIFFLLCDMALTSNLTSDQTTRLLEEAQHLFTEIQPLLSEDDAVHLMDYLERLKTLDRAETIQEQLPLLRGGQASGGSASASFGSSSFDSSNGIHGHHHSSGTSTPNQENASWMPAGLNARLLALESWPTESDALGGYLQLRWRLQGTVSRLKSIVEQSISSREKGVVSPVGLDSEDTLRKLTLFLSVDEWNPATSPNSTVSSTPMTTPSKTLATPSKHSSIGGVLSTTPISTAPFKTPSGSGIIPPSPSTRARSAFAAVGEGFLQSFLSQLLMIGMTLRDDPHIGRTDYFEHLQSAPKHLLAELVFGSRNYSKAESIASELDLDLVPLILELMGTTKPQRTNSNQTESGSKSSLSSGSSSAMSQKILKNRSAIASSSGANSASPGLGPGGSADLALDYMPPAPIGYSSNLNYEYGMGISTHNMPLGASDAKYSLHLGLVEYLKAQSPLVATLACILRAPTDKYDERFLNYALSSTKKHFAPLHLWLRVKVRQFGVFYNTKLRDQPDLVNFPIGADFDQSSSKQPGSNSSSQQPQQQSATPNTSQNPSQGSVGSLQMHGDHASSAAIQASSNRPNPQFVGRSGSVLNQSASSFDIGFDLSLGRSHSGRRVDLMSTSIASSISSMGSGLGGGGIASPTSSMNELGIGGGLQNNPVLASRAAERHNASTRADRQDSRLGFSGFLDGEEDGGPSDRRSRGSGSDEQVEGDADSNNGDSDEEHDLDISRIPSSYSPRTSRNIIIRQQTQQAQAQQDASRSLTGITSASSSFVAPSSSIDPQLQLPTDMQSQSNTTSLPGSTQVSPRGSSSVSQTLNTRFPSIDILDATEAHIFEQIFQNESLQAEFAMYSTAVNQLIQAGRLDKALQLADASLPTGAPDSLLKRLIDTAEDKSTVAGYILRMNNKTEAAQLALSLVSHWDIPTIMQVLFMCECHLKRTPGISSSSSSSSAPNTIGSQGSQATQETRNVLAKVQDMYDRVQRYAEVLEVVKDDVQARWKSWLDLDELARKDLAVVVQLLLNGGHYDIARRLTEYFKHTFLKMRVEEKYLLHLLETGDTRGVRMRLRSLEGEEAVRIAQSLMDLVTTNTDRLFLTQFIMERKSQQQRLLDSVSSTSSANQPISDLSTLSATELGLKILLCLPPELQKVFQPLMSSPSTIIESLLVSEQTLVLNKLFKEVPQVHNDDLVLKYARKALDTTRLMSTADSVLSGGGSSFATTSGSRGTTPRNVSDDEAPPQTIGYAEYEPTSPYASSRYGSSSSSVGLLATKDMKKVYLAEDRKEHSYPSAPNYPLAAGILDLCRNANLVSATCIEISDQLSTQLHSIKDRLFVVRIIQQLLYYAKLRLVTSDSPTLIQTCDILLQRTELLLQLIFCGGTATASAVVELSKSLSLSMLADPQKARALRERLIENDMADLALLVANKCGVETEPIWAAKALRMLETNRYQEAKQLFRYCLVSAYPEETFEDASQPQARSAGGLGLNPNKTVADNTTILTRIISILETNVPLEQEKLASRRTEISFLLKPAPNATAAQLKDSSAYLKRFKNMEDIDSSDSALKVLEALRKNLPNSGATSGGSSASSGHPQSLHPGTRKHTLDSIRYMQCIYYLQRFGSEEMILKFWLRHGLLEDCLRHLDSKPPPYDIKLLLLIVNHALSRNMFPRFREALYRIDKEVERWRDAMLTLCVHFHTSKMPTVLLELQITMRDYSRAGLTCMTIFNSVASPSEKLHYLELVQRFLTRALETFDENLALQQKTTSSTPRLPLSKVELARHIKTAGLQAKVVEFMETLAPSKSNPNPDSLSDDITLWGNPSMKQTITELLIVNHNFDLAFKIIQEYRLPSDKIYKDAVVAMAKRKQVKKIDELLKSIKIVLKGRDLDACMVAAARVFGLVHNDFSTADSFATKIVDQALACEAFIACRKLKQAYLIAAKIKDMDLVRAIQSEAKRLDMKREYELCDAFLKSHDSAGSS